MTETAILPKKPDCRIYGSMIFVIVTSLLVNEGINIQKIARQLGHSKIEQTWNTYAHLYPREEERAVQILNRIK